MSSVSPSSPETEPNAAPDSFGRQLLRGMAGGVPVVLGYIPVACAFALIAANAGLDAGETMLMSLWIYAGAAQMIHAGTGFWVIVLSVFILNLRHIIMSAYVFHEFHPKQKWLRFACAFGVTDEVFALTSSGFESRGKKSAPMFLGAALAAYLSWLAGTAIGLFAAFLPERLADSLAVCLYAMFIALLVPAVRKQKSLIGLVVLSALLNTIFVQFMNSGMAMIAASLIAAFLGTFLPEKDETSQAGKKADQPEPENLPEPEAGSGNKEEISNAR